MSARLELRGVECAFGDTQVLTGLDLSVAAGALVCLLGPSGCGKTTALRAVAGFESVRAGSLRIDGVEDSRPRQRTPRHQNSPRSPIEGRTGMPVTNRSSRKS